MTKILYKKIRPSIPLPCGGAKEKVLFVLFALLFFTASYAQTAPKWVKKARTAVFSVITYDK